MQDWNINHAACFQSNQETLSLFFIIVTISSENASKVPDAPESILCRTKDQ